MHEVGNNADTLPPSQWYLAAEPSAAWAASDGWSTIVRLVGNQLSYSLAYTPASVAWVLLVSLGSATTPAEVTCICSKKYVRVQVCDLGGSVACIFLSDGATAIVRIAKKHTWQDSQVGYLDLVQSTFIESHKFIGFHRIEVEFVLKSCRSGSTRRPS